MTAMWLLAMASILAVEPEVFPPSPLGPLERINVPADRPEAWPRFEGLVAVPRSEWETLWEAAHPRTRSVPGASLTKTVLRATVIGDRLVGGVLEAEVSRVGARSIWLPWEPWGLAAKDVRWADRRAVFGADPAGRHWLLVDRPQGTLQAGWSLQGQQFGRQVEFALSIPAALSTRVELRLPREQTLTTRPATLPLKMGEPNEHWRTWTIEVGSLENVVLSIATTPEQVLPPVVTYRKTLNGLVREDHIRLEATVEAEAYQAAVDTLVFTLPAAVELYSVTSGAENPVTWSRTSSGSGRDRVLVQLPDRVQGVLRPLRFEGLVPRRSNQPTVIPQFDLVDGVFLSGKQIVSVARPLQIASVRSTGCRESSPVSMTTEGESIQFDQFLPEASLTLDVRRPLSQLSARVMNTVTYDAEEWSQETQILWSTASGSLYQLATRFPAGWEVTDLDATGLDGSLVRSSWEATQDADGQTIVMVELLEPLIPGQPRFIRYRSRRQPLAEQRNVALPLPRPSEAQQVDTLVAIDGSGRFRLGIPRESSLESVLPAATAANWNEFPLWQRWAERSTAESLRWFRIDQIEATTPIFLEPELMPVQADIGILAIPDGSILSETYRLEIQPETNETALRVLVYVSELGGELQWTVASPAVASLVARRLPPEQHALWNLPANGELWEVRLPEGHDGVWKIHATRARPLADPSRIGLMFLPQAARASSTVAVRATENVNWVWGARGLQPITQETEDSLPDNLQASDLWWRYRRLTDEVVGTPRVESVAKSTLIFDGVLQTAISAGEDGQDHHQLRIRLRGLNRPLTLHWPLILDQLEVTFNGHPVTIAVDGRCTLLPVPGADAIELKASFLTPARLGWLKSRHDVPLPTGWESGAWSGFRWIIATPPQQGLKFESEGVQPEANLGEPWRRRLFGPIGRSDQEPLFLPWNPGTWQWSQAALAPLAISGAATESGWLPQGWQYETATGVAPPQALECTVTRLPRIRVLAWLLFLATGTLALFIRASGWAGRSRFSVFAMAALLGLTWLAEPPWTEVVGSLAAGAFLGAMLPRRWWWQPAISQTVEAAVPVGSTQSFILPRMMGWLLAILGVSGAAVGLIAQERPAAPPEILLVPMDPDGHPSQRLPLVYCRASLLERLRTAAASAQAAQAPPWLVERCDYLITRSRESRITLTASYRLWTPSGVASLCDLALPGITLAGTRSSLLDGRPATLTALPGKRGLQLYVPDSDSPLSALGEPLYDQHDLMLDADLPWKRTVSGGECELTGPRSTQSRVEVLGLMPASHVSVEGAQGGWERSLDQQSLTAVLGSSPKFRWLWHDSDAPDIRPTAELRVSTVEHLHVTSSAVEVRCRSVVRPVMGKGQEAAWTLPTGSIIQSVEIQPAGHIEVIPVEGAGPRLQVAFYEPLQGEATLQLRLLVRHAPRSGEFSWRGIRPVSTATVTAESTRQVWLLSAPPELRVQVNSVENSGLVPLSPDANRDLDPGGMPTAAIRAAYQVGTDAAIAFRWSATGPKLRLLQWKQTGEVHANRLHWQLDAEVDVSPVPAYAHVLLLDRRLQIDRISVRERSAERLLRWSETRLPGNQLNRVTLWLTDPSQELQHITLTSSMPLNSDRAQVLPNIRCEEAELISGRVEFRAGADRRATWPSLRGLKRLNPPHDATKTGRDDETAWDVTDVDFRASFTLSAPHPEAPGKALYVVSSVDPGDVRLRVRWEAPRTELMGNPHFRVPKPWTLEQNPDFPGVEILTEEMDAGGTVYTLKILPETMTFSGELLARAKRSDLVGQEIPLPTFTAEVAFDTWLVEVPHESQPPLLDDLTTDAGGTPPEWVTRRLREWSPMLPADLLFGLATGTPTSWPRLPDGDAEMPPGILWQEHQLWWTAADSLTGMTVLRLAHPAMRVRWQVPAGVQILGTLLDDVAGLVALVDEAHQDVRLENGQRFRTVVLLWKTDRPDPSPLSALGWTYPQAENVSAGAATVVLHPQRDSDVLMQSGWTPLSQVDHFLLRLEALGQSLPEDDRPEVAEDVATFRELYEALATHLARQPGLLEQGGPQRSERWKELVARINQLNASKARQAVAKARPEAWESSLQDPRAIYGMAASDAAVVQAWEYSRHWFHRITAILWMLLSLPVFRRLFHQDRGDWLAAHPHTAAVLLGCGWWLMLTPSLAGFALMLAAFVHGVWHYRTAAGPEAV